MALFLRRTPPLSCMAHSSVSQRAGTTTAIHCSQVVLVRRVWRWSGMCHLARRWDTWASSGRPPVGGPPAVRLPPSRPELEPGAGGRNHSCRGSGGQCVGLCSKMGPHTLPKNASPGSESRNQGQEEAKPRCEGSQKSEKPGSLASGAGSETEPRAARNRPERGRRDAETSQRRKGPGSGARGERRDGTGGASREASRSRPAGRLGEGGGGAGCGGRASSVGVKSPWSSRATLTSPRMYAPRGGRRRTPSYP